MVKSQQPERVFIVTNIISPTKKSLPEMVEGPPKIPPRMKKKGPALPDKPPHMRATPSQPPRDPLRPRQFSNADNRLLTTEREVLVAASRGAVREKPVEKRQREPAKLLMPTSGHQRKDNMVITLDDRLSYPTKDHLSYPTKKHPTASGGGGGHLRKELDDRLSYPTNKKSQARPQPILLIPRGMMPPSWSSAPAVSYALWMQRESCRREPVREVSGKARSGSVTRSGSLTSQGSSSSDSGNETFPKSVLKKQKRQTPPNGNVVKGGIVNNNSSKKLEHKKNVTFNAFATVQLMEE